MLVKTFVEQDGWYQAFELVETEEDGPEVITVTEGFVEGYRRHKAEFREWIETIVNLKQMKRAAWHDSEGE